MIQLSIPSTIYVLVLIIIKSLFFLFDYYIIVEVFAVYRESDEEKKKALKEGVVNETLPFYFAKLDAVVLKNKGYLALRRVG